MMIHYKLKNYSLLPHFAITAAAWAKRHQVDMPGTKEVIKWFKKLEKVQTAKDHDLFFAKFDEAIRKNAFKDYARELSLKAWVKNNLTTAARIPAPTQVRAVA